MKRVPLTLALLALSACQISLEPRSYACDPFLTDGGVQCTEGWSCGLDNRCFNRTPDAAVFAQNWQCEDAGHCPNGWQCGVRINDAGYCQQLGVGFPSQCLESTNCQGAWRCGADLRCFDPRVPDAGTTRACSGGDAGDDQCPQGFRCGQRVGTQQLCIELDAGANSLCVDDKGCEGGLRCNTVVQRCVVVPDVIDVGALTNLQPGVVSPLRTEPVPRLLAVSRLTILPPSLIDSPVPNPNNRGYLFAELYDAGVRVQGFNIERDRLPDGGRQAALVSRFIPTDFPNAEEMVVTRDRVVLRAGGTLRTLTYDRNGSGSLADRMEASGVRLRALSSIELRDAPQDYVVLGVGSKVERSDGGNFTIDGNTPIVEYVELGGLAFAIDATGAAHVLDAPGGSWRKLTDGGFPAGLDSTQLVTGTHQGQPALLLEVRTPLGPRVVPYLPPGPTPDLQTDVTAQLFNVCPDESRVLQLSYALEPGTVRGGAIARCARTDGGSPFTVGSRWQIQNPDSPWRLQYSQAADDLVPYSQPLVVAKTSPVMRAHAGKNGRLWFTPDIDPATLGHLGDQPLVPLLLDRQPDTVVNVKVLGGTVATNGNRLFQVDPGSGLVASFDQNPFSLLGLFTNEPTWLVTNQGILNLETVTNSGAPTEFAHVTGGSLTAPIAGFATTAVLDGVSRRVGLIASGDAVWAADVTDSSQSTFVTPSPLSPVFVPQPGVRLRSLTLVQPTTADGGVLSGVRGFLTTATSVLQFDTDDLIRWQLTEVRAPEGSALPIEVWTERGAGRVGTRDGTVWALPIMVGLSKPLPARDGGVLQADDFARTCGAQFAATREGVFTLSAGSPLPVWVPATAINAQLDTLQSMRFYETAGQLYVATQSGKVVEVVTSGPCP